MANQELENRIKELYNNFKNLESNVRKLEESGRKGFQLSYPLDVISKRLIQNIVLSKTAIQSWTHNIVFSITDADTVEWTSGTITLMNGDTFSIISGNTGNMAAETYIYLDTGVSSIVLQTTITKTDANGDNKTLVAIAENGTVEPTYFVFNSYNQNLGGTDIVAGTITGIEISASAKIVAGTGNNIGVLDGVDATYRIYAGHATPGSAPFRVTQAGVLTATGATITGTITATTGAIGGWDITSGYIYSLQSGTPTSTPNDGLVLASGNEGIICYEDTAKRLEVGYLSAGIYGLRIYDTGGSNVVFEASDTLQSIAGWYFTQTTLADNATAASANVLIDSGNSLIRLGSTAGTYITVDGASQKIESSDYVSGYAGAGFHLSAGLLETGNIACRGIIRTAVFQKDVISAVGGNVAILDADVLATDMTALDSANVVIEGNTTFSNGDILRIKDGTDDEWMTVTNASGAPTYVVDRDEADAYGGGVGGDGNPTWKKGASVVNYGTTGDGGVYMTASETNAPYLSVFTHAGAPWTTLTTRLRIGNLNGYLGYVSDKYGIGIGEINNSMTYDPTNGLRITGTITGGTIQTSTSNQRVVIEGTDNSLRFYDSSSQVIGMGVEAGTAIKITGNATTHSGVLMNSTVAGIGFSYTNNSAVNSVGLDLVNTSNGGTLPSIRVTKAGSGEILFGDVQGAGRGIHITRTIGAGTTELLKLLNSSNVNATMVHIHKSGTTGSANMVNLECDDSGIALIIQRNKVTSAQDTLRIVDAGTGNSLFIDKNNSGNAIDIDQDANDGNNTIGIKMSIINAGGGSEYALELLGSEYDATKTGVSGLTGVIKIITHTDGAVFIPVYSTAT